MRILIIAVLLAVSMFRVAEAQQEHIQSVIDGQMQAFRSGDVAQAFTFASPMIKGIFGSSQAFGMMVQRGYPMVWQPGAVQFLQLERQDEEYVQRVHVTDGSGRIHALDYYMIETADGWQINGVVLLPAPDIGV